MRLVMFIILCMDVETFPVSAFERPDREFKIKL